MRTIELMDKAIQANKLPSDYALAMKMGTSRQVVSRWRNGATPDPFHAVLLADLAGVDRIAAIAFTEIERAEKANRDTHASEWRDLLGITESAAEKVKEYAGKVAGTAITGFLVGAILSAPSPGNASSIPAGKLAQGNQSPVYIM